MRCLGGPKLAFASSSHMSAMHVLFMEIAVHRFTSISVCALVRVFKLFSDL